MVNHNWHNSILWQEGNKTKDRSVHHPIQILTSLLVCFLLHLASRQSMNSSWKHISNISFRLSLLCYHLTQWSNFQMLFEEKIAIKVSLCPHISLIFYNRSVDPFLYSIGCLFQVWWLWQARPKSVSLEFGISIFGS